MNEAAAKLHQKLLKARAEMEYLKKDGEYKEQNVKKYNFLSAEKIVHSVRDKLIANGLSLLVDTESATELPQGTTRSNSAMYRVRLCLKITITDTETGYAESARGYGDGFDVGDKAIAKAYTIAFKYWLRMQLMIETGDEDPDAKQLPEMLPEVDISGMSKEEIEKRFDSYEFTKGEVAAMRDNNMTTKRDMVAWRSRFKSNADMMKAL